jgi:hypothetical protein
VQNSILLIKPDTHKINIQSLQYKVDNVAKYGNLIYIPFDKVKITISTGVNNNAFININRDISTNTFYIKTINEVDSKNMINILKYDARMKIYLNKKWRFLMVAQIVGFGNNAYSVGFCRKI